MSFAKLPMNARVSIRLLAAQSDERLLALVSEGHERAFETLVQRYRRPLLRYCHSLGLADARAEDVLQHALLQAWLSLASGAEVRDLKAWLYRVVHNAALNAVRGAAERHGELTEAIQASAALAAESDLERTIAVRDALTDVAALPHMQSQAIFLTAVDGQSHDEVASSLGISEGALRGLLYRGRATLRSPAAAFTPAPLLQWAAGGGASAGQTAERLGELSAGGAGAGIAGLLVKGAVVAVTLSAVASGAAVVEHHSHRSRHAGQRRDSARVLSPAGAEHARPVPANATAPSLGAVADSRSQRDRANSGHGAPDGRRGAGKRADRGAGRDLRRSRHQRAAETDVSRRGERIGQSGSGVQAPGAGGDGAGEGAANASGGRTPDGTARGGTPSSGDLSGAGSGDTGASSAASAASEASSSSPRREEGGAQAAVGGAGSNGDQQLAPAEQSIANSDG